MSEEKKKDQVSISFGLREIELIESKLAHPDKKLPDDITFHFNLDIEYRVFPDKERVLVLTKVRVSNEEDKEMELGKITTSCAFEIKELEKWVDDQERLVLPQDLKTTLNSVALSTTRGVLYSEYRGTFLDKALIPLIDVQNLTEDNNS